MSHVMKAVAALYPDCPDTEREAWYAHMEAGYARQGHPHAQGIGIGGADADVKEVVALAAHAEALGLSPTASACRAVAVFAAQVVRAAVMDSAPPQAGYIDQMAWEARANRAWADTLFQVDRAMALAIARWGPG